MALDALANQILDFSRIVTNADSLAPGKPFRIDFLPGALPAIPSVGDLTATLTNVKLDQAKLVNTTVPADIVGNIVGTLTGALNVLPGDLSITITPSIT